MKKYELGVAYVEGIVSILLVLYLLFTSAYSFIKFKETQPLYEMRDKCEKDLPRNKFCKFVTVPIE